MKEMIERLLKESISVKEQVRKSQSEQIAKIATSFIECLNKKGKIIFFGNGGSASDSQHIAAELVGRFQKNRVALAAIALTTNASTLTALGNDYTFDSIFARQIEALANPPDIAVGISTSGKAGNVIEAVKKANQKGIFTIALTGKDGGDLAKIAKLALIVPSQNTARIQEAHITIAHIICQIVEEHFS